MAERSGSAVKGNGFDGPMMSRYTDEILKRHKNIDRFTGEHMSRCKAERDEINRVYDVAKDSGVPKKEYKAVIKTTLLQMKLDSIRDELADGDDSADSVETYDMIRHALGQLADTPLGQAAEKKATKGKGMPGGDSPGSAH